MRLEKSPSYTDKDFIVAKVTPVDPDQLRSEVRQDRHGRSTADRPFGVDTRPMASGEVVNLHNSLRRTRARRVAHHATGQLVGVAR